LLIDPKVGLEASYRSLIAQYRLKLVAVVDTHTHADHLSAAPRWVGDEVTLYMSKHTHVDRPMTRLGHGDALKVGSLRFQVREVPGHTPDSIALYWDGGEHPGAVFSGDSLLIGGLARADFRGSDPVLLWEAVRRELLSLPPDTVLYPGHSYDNLLFSTIGHERDTNPDLAYPNGEAYAAARGIIEGAGNSPAVDQVLGLNMERDPHFPEHSAPAAACCASPGQASSVCEPTRIEGLELKEAHDGLEGPRQWVDVRDPFEVEHGRIPGVTHIPLGELGFYLDHFRGQDRVYISCRSGVRSMSAIRTLQRLGVCSDPVNVEGGILAWQALGLPIEGQPAR